MTDLMLKNVVEAINHELKNGLIYVVIEDYCHPMNLLLFIAMVLK